MMVNQCSSALNAYKKETRMELIKDSIHVTCHICPAQIEARLDNGWYLYGRARFSRFSIAVDPVEEKAIMASDAAHYLVGTLPGEYATCCPQHLIAMAMLYVDMLKCG